MAKHSTIMKNMLGVLLGIAILAPLAYVPVAPFAAAPEAHAIDAEVVSIGGIEGTMAGLSLLNTAGSTLTSATANSASTLIMQILNGIAWKVAKDMLQSMSKSMLTWLNSGYNGAPAFVTNLEKELLKASDTQATRYINQLAQSSGLASAPYKAGLVTGQSNGYFKSTGKGTYFDKNPYTLDKATGGDAKSFLSGNNGKGDLSKGGLDAFSSLFSNCSNNPYCAYEQSLNDLSTSASGAAGTQSKLIDQSGGWLPWKGNDCASAKNLSLPPDLTVTLDPALLGSTGSGQTITANVPAGATAPVSLSSLDNCLGYDIQTPASLLRDLAPEQIRSSMRTLENVHSINEAITAFASQLIEDTLNKGFSGLVKPKPGGGASTVASTAVSSQSAQANKVTTDGIVSQVSQQKDALAQYQQNWQTIQTQAQAAATACASNPTSLAQAQTVLTQATAAQKSSTDLLTKLNAINDQVTKAQNATGDAQTVEFQTLNTMAQTFLADPTQSPTALRDQSRAQAQDTGSGTPSSLFTQMKNLAQSCTVGVIHGI
jgi:hypothetical protein